jgi:hypothetical protein
LEAAGRAEQRKLATEAANAKRMTIAGWMQRAAALAIEHDGRGKEIAASRLTRLFAKMCHRDAIAKLKLI